MSSLNSTFSVNHLGGAQTLYIDDSPLITAICLSEDHGKANPDWLKLQGVPYITFFVKPSAPNAPSQTDKTLIENKARILAILEEQQIKVIPVVNHYGIRLEDPEDLPKAAVAIGISQSDVDKIQGLQADVLCRHQKYLATVDKKPESESERILGIFPDLYLELLYT